MVPYSVARGHVRHQMQKRAQLAQLRAGRGERMISAMIPGRGYSWQTRTQDRWTQIWHMKNWTGVCIDKLASLCAQLVPNVARVRPAPSQKTQKWFTHDYSRIRDWSGFTSGTYQRKALSGVKPHEEVEPVEWNHPLRKLIENPNDYDTQFTHDYELLLFLLLTGVSYDWAVPWDFYDSNSLFPGVPKELWVVPSPWVWPIGGDGRPVDKNHPFADHLVAYYEVRPWGNTSGGPGVMRIPPNQMIVHRYPSPVSKIDGWAKTWLGAEWIDADDSIAKSQRAQMSNGGFPSFWLKLGEGYEDPTDETIDRIMAKFAQKHMGENAMGMPFVGPPGIEPVPLEFPPTEMAYGEAQDQSRDRIISLFGLNLALLGLSENQTFGSVLANLSSTCQNTIKPLLTMIGQTKTKFLATKFPQADGPLRIWYDDPTPVDPEQLNKDIEQDAKWGAITTNEIRQIRNRMPYKMGDNPLVNGPGGLVPLPINEEEDMSYLSELVPLMGRQENPAAEEEEAAAGLGSPQVEEPNGKPSKKSWSESDHPRGQPDNAGQFAPTNNLPGQGEEGGGRAESVQVAKPTEKPASELKADLIRERRAGVEIKPKMSRTEAVALLNKMKRPGWQDAQPGRGHDSPTISMEGDLFRISMDGRVAVSQEEQEIAGKFTARDGTEHEESTYMMPSAYLGSRGKLVGHFKTPAGAMVEAEIRFKIMVEKGDYKKELTEGQKEMLARVNGPLEASIQEGVDRDRLLPNGKEIPEGYYKCPKCAGMGSLFEYGHVAEGVCFMCNGAGIKKLTPERKPKKRFTHKMMGPRNALPRLVPSLNGSHK